MCRCHFDMSPHLPLLLMMLFVPASVIVPESLSRDAGKWELKVKPEMGVCDNSLKSRKIKQNVYGHFKKNASGFSMFYSYLYELTNVLFV